MPHSFLRGRWLRSLSIGATVCLSAALLNAADGPESTEGLAQVSNRAVVRETEHEELTQYPGLTIIKPGSSTTIVRKQSIADLGLERLSPEAQQKSQAVLKNLGMFRKLPTISFECDPSVYEYFLSNPDVAVSTWRAMDISQFQLHETGPNQYHADAGDGSIGDLELLIHTPTDTMIHCDGAFKSPLLPKPIIARSLMRVQTTFSKEQDGRIIGTHSGDVYVEFPSQAIEAAARVIAPVSHSIADRNFKQMTLFVHLMSQAMVKHPDGSSRLEISWKGSRNNENRSSSKSLLAVVAKLDDDLQTPIHSTLFRQMKHCLHFETGVRKRMASVQQKVRRDRTLIDPLNKRVKPLLRLNETNSLNTNEIDSWRSDPARCRTSSPNAFERSGCLHSLTRHGNHRVVGQ